jgi:L-seryl-tRNA(Ser) seleniumtransferase
MNKNHNQQDLLRKLPSVDRILDIVKTKPFSENIPKSILVRSIRVVIENFRSQILSGNQETTAKSLSDTIILEKVKENIQKAMTPNLIRVVNATGVVVHTNLGRSLLATDTLKNLATIAGMYSNLEFDLEAGVRGSRYSCVEDIICEISGAEAAMVVNNNAGAVLLCLETIAKGRKVIVSRGELVEIGGSFRIPDVMERSGGILMEVGTTNRTHLHDYQNAIDDDTALLLKVHKSNYSIVGFSAEVSLKELVELGKAHHLPVMEDLGSGTFIDFSEYGLVKEPTVQESVATQADVITFSGDKLLGGPQAGIIVGKSQIIEKIKKNPITRALRIDKLTLAALESTLRLYRTPQCAVEAIPTLYMLTLPLEAIEKKARQLVSMLGNVDNPLMDIQLLDRSSKAGGGALPLLDLPSKCIGVKIKGITANAIERSMRNNTPPIIGRIEEDFFIMDLRTIQEDEFFFIKSAFDTLQNEL